VRRHLGRCGRSCLGKHGPHEDDGSVGGAQRVLDLDETQLLGRLLGGAAGVVQGPGAEANDGLVWGAEREIGENGRGKGERRGGKG
jgi:hypothetical protein